jgi:hypothetical protein
LSPGRGKEKSLVSLSHIVRKSYRRVIVHFFLNCKMLQLQGDGHFAHFWHSVLQCQPILGVLSTFFWPVSLVLYLVKSKLPYISAYTYMYVEAVYQYCALYFITSTGGHIFLPLDEQEVFTRVADPDPTVSGSLWPAPDLRLIMLIHY